MSEEWGYKRVGNGGGGGGGGGMSEGEWGFWKTL